MAAVLASVRRSLTRERAAGPEWVGEDFGTLLHLLCQGKAGRSWRRPIECVLKGAAACRWLCAAVAAGFSAGPGGGWQPG